MTRRIWMVLPPCGDRRAARRRAARLGPRREARVHAEVRHPLGPHRRPRDLRAGLEPGGEDRDRPHRGDAQEAQPAGREGRAVRFPGQPGQPAGGRRGGPEARQHQQGPRDHRRPVERGDERRRARRRDPEPGAHVHGRDEPGPHQAQHREPGVHLAAGGLGRHPGPRAGGDHRRRARQERQDQRRGAKRRLRHEPVRRLQGRLDGGRRHHPEVRHLQPPAADARQRGAGDDPGQPGRVALHRLLPDVREAGPPALPHRASGTRRRRSGRTRWSTARAAAPRAGRVSARRRRTPRRARRSRRSRRSSSRRPSRAPSSPPGRRRRSTAPTSSSWRRWRRSRRTRPRSASTSCR